MSSPLGQSFFDVIAAIIFVSPSHPSEPTPAIKAPSGNHQMFLKMLITVQSRNLGVSEFPKICLFTWTQRLTLKFYKKIVASSKLAQSHCVTSHHTNQITKETSRSLQLAHEKGVCDNANNNNVSQILQRDHRSSILIYVDI